MVDRTIYSPEFRRMVAKAYLTSSKSLLEIGKDTRIDFPRMGANKTLLISDRCVVEPGVILRY